MHRVLRCLDVGELQSVAIFSPNQLDYGFNPSLTIQALAYRTSAKILASGHIPKGL